MGTRERCLVCHRPATFMVNCRPLCADCTTIQISRVNVPIKPKTSVVDFVEYKMWADAIEDIKAVAKKVLNGEYT